MKKRFILLLAPLLGNALHAQFLKATHEESNYKDIKGILATQLYGYSQLVYARLQGYFMLLSGQTPWDGIGTLIEKGNFKRQLQYCMQTIEKILTAKCAQKNQCVKLNYYVKNFNECKTNQVTQVAKQFFAHSCYPAGSLLDVAKLADDHFPVKVEASALVVNP